MEVNPFNEKSATKKVEKILFKLELSCFYILPKCCIPFHNLLGSSADVRHFKKIQVASQVGNLIYGPLAASLHFCELESTVFLFQPEKPENTVTRAHLEN